MLGGAAPFDRHDWIVDRCGKEVRYVIDFYFYDEKAGTPQVRVRRLIECIRVIECPCPVAPESWQAFMHRIVLCFRVSYPSSLEVLRLHTLTRMLRAYDSSHCVQ